MTSMIRVLHLTPEPQITIRLQRYLRSNMNMGIQPIVFCRTLSQAERRIDAIHDIWIPDFSRIPIRYYKPSRLMTYLLPSIFDEIGLKSIYRKYNCDLVHAHSPDTAYYSYKLGLPTIFDDWEFWLEHLDYMTAHVSSSPEAKIKRDLKPRQIYHSALLYYKIRRVKNIVKDLIKHTSLIVTNKEVERKYREMGASSIYWIPNVPMRYEMEYALAVQKKKMDKITTCYIGNMTRDEKTFLRNTTGIRNLWCEEKLGGLYVFEGENRVPHLEVMRKVRECHFNLLFWKPLNIHRYYIQNKAFLASVVGVPTIISSSLKATVSLLGELALSVDSINEIPDIIRNYDYSKKYSFDPAHLWEYYESRIKRAYEDVLDRAVS